MKNNPARRLRHLLDRAQRRFIHSRPGSVLILVVALLVMMALIGTAFMTMAQFDRGTAIVHSFNTEVDLLLDGVVNQVKGTVVNDVFSGGTFRPAEIVQSSTAQPVTYNTPLNNAAPRYWTGLGYDTGTASVAGIQAGDWWLASRVPGLQNEAAAPSAANLPWWPFLSGPVNGGATFDQPYWPPTNTAGNPQPTPLTQRTQLIPTYTQSSPGAALVIDGQVWPAFTTVGGGIPNTVTKMPWMAADTDGDGVADSGLVKLLTLDGVTYYAAVRVVDNSGAINASIAEAPNPATAYSAGATMPGDLSPVNIDLAGLVNQPTDLVGTTPGGAGLINYFRWNGQSPSLTGIDDSGNPRNDFQFTADGGAYFLAQWFQLGRRLRNPGFIAAGVKYQGLPISEDLAMARGFVVRNSSVTNSALSPSVLEQRMPATLFTPAPTAAYGPDASTTPASFPYPLKWFSDSFYYAGEYTSGTNTLSKRPLIVAQNPVSNFSPGRFNMNPTGTPYYEFGDVITRNGSKFVCIATNPASAPPSSPMPVPQSMSPAPDQYWSDPCWAWEPWTNAPTKTSINTATFQQLYAAFWAVMADQYIPTPTGGTVPGRWAPAFPNNADASARMFRNPCRSWYALGKPTTIGGMSPPQVMYLRAALAAINTMQLRGGNQANITTYGTNDVLSRTIYVADEGATAAPPPHYKISVYGAEKQPYLTHIFAHNDPKGKTDPTLDFMAVEFYNPYNTAINIGGWKLAIVDRSTQGNLTVQPLDPSDQTISNLVTLPAKLTSIGPGGKIVLLSSLTPPSTIDPGPPPAPNFYECKALNNAFGKELVLMRPRLAKGTAISSSVLNNTFDETASTTSANLVGLYDWIPVDSYDFTNIPQQAKDSKNSQNWDYVRPDADSANKQWHFVYPGPWQVAGASGPGADASTTPTWSATVATQSSQPIPFPTSFGNANKTVLPNPNGVIYQDVALQVNNVDFGGPNKLGGPGTPNLPLGAFARDGDLLQTTYIGAYKVVDITGGAPKLVELNTISADSAMATAADYNETPRYQPYAGPTTVVENLGRFCPIDLDDVTAAKLPAPNSSINDFALPTTSGTPPVTTPSSAWRYHWATRLFDFLSVHSPQDDYLPNIDPWSADANYQYNYRYLPANSGSTNVPAPVANLLPGAANAGLNPQASPVPNIKTVTTEDTVPIDGLVNINTAPWRVLAAVPWIPATFPNYRNLNAQVGLAIATYRDFNDGTGKPHGPFRNLFELGDAQINVQGTPYRVRDILRLAGGSPANASNYTPKEGNLAPISGSAAVMGDFQGQFNAITRLSNLITTRSDSFTAYVLIQGWRNAETATPHLVVQRRAAVNIDRSNVTPTNRSPNAVNVPMN